MMAPDEAAEYAQRLALMPRFPTSPAALNVLAEELYTLCNGADEAEWLATEIETRYRTWPGLGTMRKTYAARYHPQARPETKEWTPPPRPPAPECDHCHGLGFTRTGHSYHWCDCADAEQVRAAAPDTVDRLNRIFARVRARRHSSPDIDAPTRRGILAARLAARRQNQNTERGDHETEISS